MWKSYLQLEARYAWKKEEGQDDSSLFLIQKVEKWQLQEARAAAELVEMGKQLMGDHRSTIKSTWKRERSTQGSQQKEIKDE